MAEVGGVAAQPRLTRGRMFVVAAMNLVDTVNMNLLTPYAATMVSTFEQRGRADGAVLRQVGMLIGIYNLSEMFLSPLWGSLSDRFGRRVVLLTVLAGVAFTAICFGLSSSLPTAFLFRALAGVFCGNVGVTKTYLAELVDETNDARAFSLLSLVKSLGMFVGPLVGGTTVFPAKWAPSLFQGTVFDEKPFLLPSFCLSVFCVLVWLLAFCCLEETLPSEERRELAARRAKGHGRAFVGVLGTDDGDGEKTSGACRWLSSQLPLHDAPPQLLRIMLAYGLVVGYIVATTQTFVLIVQIPHSDGGFDLPPYQVALLQNCAAGGLMLTQVVLYPWLVQKKGYRFCMALGSLTVMAVTFPFPLYGLMADAEKFGMWRLVPLGCLMFVQMSAFGLCTPTCNVWVNRFAGGMNRGSVNGWTNSFVALCRALAPVLCSALLGLGLSSGLPLGRYLPVYVTALAGVFTLVLAIPVLPDPRLQAQAKTEPKVEADADAVEQSGQLQLKRAGTWWHDQNAAVLDLDDDVDLEAGALPALRSGQTRRNTW